MADPTTELAKEFLEFNDYLVRKETKFQKNKKLQGTPSDIDIIATRPNIKKIGELELRENIIEKQRTGQSTQKKPLMKSITTSSDSWTTTQRNLGNS